MSRGKISSLFVFSPAAACFAQSFFNVEFFWFFDDKHKLFDLLYGSVLFLAFAYGLWLSSLRVKNYLISALFLIFTFYQTAVWGLTSERYMVKIQISTDAELALIRNDQGVFSSGNQVKLVRFENLFYLWLAKKEVDSFDDVKSATITKDGDIVNLDIVPFEGKPFFKYVDIKDI
jgi:hypothetical protein